MSSFSYEWDNKSQSKLPAYGKNARKKIKKTALYISLWDHLKHNVYIYTRHFHNWEIYVLFIAHTFPNLKIDDIKNDLTNLLSEFYIIHNRESTGITPYGCKHNTTNDMLNSFLDILREKVNDNILNAFLDNLKEKDILEI